jgi:glycosyltransferase involved in cell wall biosynthesis
METNRDYISYSQFTLFNSSPKLYYEKYVTGKKQFSTKYQAFGKKLMEDLEFAEDDVRVPAPLRKLGKKGLLEHEITISGKNIKKDLFGIVDVISNDYTEFWEIKTGKHPWDESKVFNDEQMLFYAVMISLKYKVIPTATLVWAETRDDEDGNVVIYTGRVKEFKRVFKMEELLDFYKKIALTINKIEDYEHSIVVIDEDRDAKLLRLLSEQKKITNELDILKTEIMLELNEFLNKYAESENFNITLAKRTNYTYSEALSSQIKKTNTDFKILKAIEEKNGVATPKTTEYLLIKPKK